jgi:hypothetical protein
VELKKMKILNLKNKIDKIVKKMMLEVLMNRM